MGEEELQWGNCINCGRPHTSSEDDRYVFMNDQWCDKCNLKYEKLDYDEHINEIADEGYDNSY